MGRVRRAKGGAALQRRREEDGAWGKGGSAGLLGSFGQAGTVMLMCMTFVGFDSGARQGGCWGFPIHLSPQHSSRLARSTSSSPKPWTVVAAYCLQLLRQHCTCNCITGRS